ncbi:hypothetical protein F5Y15DRAFT_371434 [Xylariaceae sp. FL0016]|nr:hypothetical protein F5Y15DRAFT_371434 [Xylariaceae sp. FL0016]
MTASSNPNWDRLSYLERRQWDEFKWRDYREEALNYTSFYNDNDIERHRSTWSQILIPDNSRPVIFRNDPWDPRDWRSSRAIGRIVGPLASENSRLGKAQVAFRQLQAYFGQPVFTVQKPLGFGGNGLAVHYRYHGPNDTDQPGRDIVVKRTISEWEDDYLLKEENIMRKVKKAAHCVQLIELDEINHPARQKITLDLEDDDSSVDGDSSGEDSLPDDVLREKGRRWRTPRANRLLHYFAQKNVRRQEREQEIDDERAKYKENTRRDFIVLEFLENGDLASLITKLREDKNGDGEIPNRVLWAFWLCMVRACVGLEWAPRKVHPSRKRPPSPPPGQPTVESARKVGMFHELKALGFKLLSSEAVRIFPSLENDLIEQVPKRRLKRNRRMNLVHFDIDPRNVLINGLELDTADVEAWDKIRAESDKKDQDDDSGNTADDEWAPGEFEALDLNQEHGQTQAGPSNTTNPGEEDNEDGDIPSTIILSENETGKGKGKAIQEEKKDKKKELRRLRHTGRRLDRAEGEHALVPRLKLGDFGIAQFIKPHKRNIYYDNMRRWAKMGYFAPEQFADDWKSIPANADGDEAGLAPVAGNYGSHTNVWGIALTMWCLITKLEPPAPPDPQPPYELNGTFNYSNDGKQLVHEAIDDEPKYANFRVSYCPLLMDPTCKTYDWVDKELRQTIFECMYHRPADRPSIQKLLQQALKGARKAFPGEDDDSIRRWVNYWFYTPRDDDTPASSSAAEQNPGGQPHAPGGGASVRPQVLQQAARDDPNHPARQQLQIQFNAAFPYGFDRIHNNASQLQCGLVSVVDSIAAQIGPTPIINGVQTAIVLPDQAALDTIYRNLANTGHFDIIRAAATPDPNPNPNQAGNYYISELAVVLAVWGQTTGLELQLGYILPGRGPLAELSQFNHPRVIWIYNDNANDVAQGANDAKGKGVDIPRIINHYEGMRPKPRPPPSGGDDSGAELSDGEI